MKDRDGAEPTICPKCAQHQGKALEARIERAEAHERWLREYLDACRKSEERAQLDLRRAKIQVASALESRGQIASRVLAAADIDPDHNCSLTRLARETDVVRFALRHRGEMVDDDDEDDDMYDEHGNFR